MSSLYIDPKFRLDMKKYLLTHVKAGTPFQYLMNLSLVGESDYGVKREDSLEYGVNAALDYYNQAPSNARKFYSLMRGAEAIINYVDYHKEKDVK